MAEKFASPHYGYLALAKQTVLGTYVTPTKFLKITSCNLKENIENREVVDDIAFGRSFRTHTDGRVAVGGSIGGYLNPDEFGFLMAELLGNNNAVAGGATTGYTHTFNEYISSSLFAQAGFSCAVSLGGETGTSTATLRDFIGCFLSKLTVTIPVTGICTWTADVVGIKEATQTTLLTPTYATVPPFMGWMGKLEIGDVIGTLTTAPVHADISIEYDNGINLVPAIDGTKYASGYTLGRPAIMVKFANFIENNLTYYGYFKNNTPKAIKASINHTVLAGSSSGVHSVAFYMPRVFFKGDQPELAVGQNVSQPIEVQAEYDPTTAYTFKAEVVDSVSGVYAV